MDKEKKIAWRRSCVDCAFELPFLSISILTLFKWVKIDIFHTEINHTRQSWLLCAPFVVRIQSRCAQLQNNFSTKNASIDGPVRKSIGSFQEFSERRLDAAHSYQGIAVSSIHQK